MDEPADATLLDTPPEMNLTKTPQQMFERADSMFLQAAVIRAQADKLLEHVEKMYEDALQWQEGASSLQKLGMQTREKWTNTLNKILEKHKDVLSQYNIERPNIIQDLTSGVEDGIMHLEQVEMLDEDLQAFADTLHSKSRRSSVSSDNSGYNQHHSPSRQLEADVAETPANLTTSTAESRPECTNSSNWNEVTSLAGETDNPVTKEELIRLSRTSLDFPTQLQQPEQASTVQQESDNMCTIPPPKKQNTETDKKRKHRRFTQLRQAGYDSDEISDTMLSMVQSPRVAKPHKKRIRLKRRKQQAKKGKDDEV